MAVEKTDAGLKTEEQKKAWKNAAKLIAKGRSEEALSVLRELDEGGAHPTTLRLAGEATHKIGQRTGSKSDYRKAGSLFREAEKMNPQDKKLRKAQNALLSEMQEKGIRKRSFRGVGYAITVFAALVLVAGTAGFSLEPASREAPASPPSFTQGTVFFGPEPLRGNPVPFLLSAQATVTWDRSDLFLVIADKDKKEECDSIPPIERMLSTSETCKAGDTEYEVVGENGTVGLSWTAERGEYYVGVGTVGESNPAGEGFQLTAVIDLHLSAGGYVVFLLIGAFGVRLIKND